MPAPNMFIVYVSDAPTAGRFYSELFDLKPLFESPAFLAYDLGGGVQLALWGGGSSALTGVRTSEVCLTVSGGPAEIDRHFQDWTRRGVTVVEEPHDAVFGRTFVVADPDGNLIRVAPVD